MNPIDPERASRLGRRSRTKGASFERMIAIELRGLYGQQVRRGLGQARAAGEVPDVDGTPWWVECKHGKRPNIPRAIAQAIEASAGRRPPLVISRANAEPILVTMLLADLKKLVKHAQDCADVAIARKRLAEIKQYPDRLLGGPALERRLAEMEKTDGIESTETARKRTTETTEASDEKDAG